MVTAASVVRVGGNGTAAGRSLWFWCPGCDDSHRITVDSPNGWTWDGNETAPTIEPSILVHSHGTLNEHGHRVETPTCHSFLRGGRWQFLSDSTHPLSGKSDVPMCPLPDWLNAAYVA